jgi:hypothetical protein
MAVVALPGQGDEQFPGLAGAGIGAHPGQGVSGPGMEQSPLGGGQNFSNGEGGSHFISNQLLVLSS